MKTEQIKKKKKAELKQFLLTDKQQDYGVMALLARELDLARLEKDIEEPNNFIAAYEAHKVSLQMYLKVIEKKPSQVMLGRLFFVEALIIYFESNNIPNISLINLVRLNTISLYCCLIDI